MIVILYCDFFSSSLRSLTLPWQIITLMYILGFTLRIEEIEVFDLYAPVRLLLLTFICFHQFFDEYQMKKIYIMKRMKKKVSTANMNASSSQ